MQFARFPFVNSFCDGLDNIIAVYVLLSTKALYLTILNWATTGKVEHLSLNSPVQRFALHMGDAVV